MNVGLVAHDGKKNLMQNLCIAYQDILKKHKLYATSTTGQMIEDVELAVKCSIPVEHFGRLGGIVPDPDEVIDALKEKIINK